MPRRRATFCSEQGARASRPCCLIENGRDARSPWWFCFAADKASPTRGYYSGYDLSSAPVVASVMMNFSRCMAGSGLNERRPL